MKKPKNCWFAASNVYKLLLLKFLWVFLALNLTQLLFALCNQNIFQVQGREWWGVLWGNVVFGIVTTATLMAVYAPIMLLPLKIREKRWFRILTEGYFTLKVLVALLANLCDCGYFPFTFRRISSDIFAYLTIGGQMGNLIPHFLVDYWHITLCGTAIITLWLLLNFKTHWVPFRQETHPANGWTGFVVGTLMLCLLIRGGVTHYIQLTDAARFVPIERSALVVNSPYSILRTGVLPRSREMNKQVGEPPVFNADHSPHDTLPLWQASHGCWHDTLGNSHYTNIVVIVLESFSQEYMGCYGAQESFTPFLDSLYSLSYCYDGRANGKKSIEGIPSIFASLPTLMETPIALSKYRNNNFEGLPAALQTVGYSTAFFHGGYNGTMDFDNLCRRIGFQHYYGMDEYVAQHGREAYDHAWGIFDEPFLQYTADEIGQMQEPFMAGIFTISSHHPYTVAPGYEGKLKKGEHPLLQVVNYTDNALRQFFKRIEHEPWFERTLFVITADHPGRGIKPEFYHPGNQYRIPMMFFRPHSHDSLCGNQHRMMQQIDIMPTLLDYVHDPTCQDTSVCHDFENPICFGQSVFSGKKPFHIAYGNGFYIYECQNTAPQDQAPALLLMSGNHLQGDTTLAPAAKAFIDTYNNCMIHNRTAHEKTPLHRKPHLWHREAEQDSANY